MLKERSDKTSASGAPSVATQHTGREDVMLSICLSGPRADEFDNNTFRFRVCTTLPLWLVDCVMSLPLLKDFNRGRVSGTRVLSPLRIRSERAQVYSRLWAKPQSAYCMSSSGLTSLFFLRSLFNLVLIWKWGVLAKVLAVNKSPEMVFVVLFVSLSAIYRVGLSGSIAVLICFQSSSSAPFLKSKIDMFSAAVPPPLCFSSVWDWGWSIAETCFTSCCAAYNYRAPRISSEDYS